MLTPSDRIADNARVALALIRLFNGVLALLLPKMLIRRLGLDDAANVAMVYPLRMFGIRTILIGLDLLLAKGEIRVHGERMAIVVHGADTATALIARLDGQLPARQATIALAISATNLVLSILIRPRN